MLGVGREIIGQLVLPSSPTSREANQANVLEHYNYGISTLTIAATGHVSQRASKPTRNLPSHQKAVKNK